LRRTSSDLEDVSRIRNVARRGEATRFNVDAMPEVDG